MQLRWWRWWWMKLGRRGERWKLMGEGSMCAAFDLPLYVHVLDPHIVTCVLLQMTCCIRWVGMSAVLENLWSCDIDGPFSPSSWPPPNSSNSVSRALFRTYLAYHLLKLSSLTPPTSSPPMWSPVMSCILSVLWENTASSCSGSSWGCMIEKKKNNNHLLTCYYSTPVIPSCFFYYFTTLYLSFSPSPVIW